MSHAELRAVGVQRHTDWSPIFFKIFKNVELQKWLSHTQSTVNPSPGKKKDVNGHLSHSGLRTS